MPEISFTITVLVGFVTILLLGFYYYFRSTKYQSSREKLVGSIKKGESIVLLGCKAAGKSALLYSVTKYKKRRVETVTSMIPNVLDNIIDVPGCEIARMDQYLPLAKAVAFVIDSSDFQKKQVAEGVYQLLGHCKPGTPIAFVCNKQDLSSSLSIAEIKEKLEISLHSYRDSHRRVVNDENMNFDHPIVETFDESKFSLDDMIDHSPENISFIPCSVPSDLKPFQDWVSTYL